MLKLVNAQHFTIVNVWWCNSVCFILQNNYFWKGTNLVHYFQIWNESGGQQALNRGQVFFLNMLIKYYQNRSLLYSLRFSCLYTSVSCLNLTVALHHLCTDLKFFSFNCISFKYFIIVYLFYCGKKRDSCGMIYLQGHIFIIERSSLCYMFVLSITVRFQVH